MKVVNSTAIICFMFVTGCSKSPLVPAKGRVTLDGQPVNLAMVQFIPQNSSATAGRVPHASSGMDGGFTMTTHEFGDGVLPGKYKIVVTKNTQPASILPPPVPKAAPDAGEDGRTEEMKKMEQMMSGMASRNRTPPKSELPEVYGNIKTTTLSVEIPDEGNENIELSLVTK